MQRGIPTLSDASDNPVTDLEPLMGAGGHSVIISSDLQELQEFLHVYPIEEEESNWKGGHIYLLEPTFQSRDYTKHGEQSMGTIPTQR